MIEFEWVLAFAMIPAVIGVLALIGAVCEAIYRMWDGK